MGERPSGDQSLYSKEYGEVQGRGVAQEYLDILAEKFKNVQGMKVLELGVGSGSLLPFLKEKFGEKNVFGVDLGSWILRNSPLNKGENNIETDIHSLPIQSESMDRVVTLHTLEHAVDLKTTLEEIDRVLKPNGEAVVVVPNPQFGIRQLGALVDTLRMYTGFNRLVDTWKKAEGIGKVTEVLKQYKTAWDEAGKYHVQNVTKEKIENVKTGLEITEAKSVFVPWEMGSSWVITLEKRGTGSER